MMPRNRLTVLFSDALVLTGALFWDRRRPRLHVSPLRCAHCNVSRRGRLRSQKGASVSSRTSLKGLVCTYRMTEDHNMHLNKLFLVATFLFMSSIVFAQTMSVEEYEPKSTLVTSEHKPTRAKYPFCLFIHISEPTRLLSIS